MIHHGDLFDVLPGFAAASIDAVVTDPPYGIGFMGREWDTFKPGVEEARIVPNKQIESDNPNLRGRTRGPASSPASVEYDYTVKGLREFQDWTQRWATEVFRVMKPGAYIVVCCAPRSYHRMACGLEEAGFVIRDKFSWLFGSGFPKNYNLGDGKGTALKPAHEPIALAWKPFKGTIKSCHETHGTAALNIEACRIETFEPGGRPGVFENHANQSVGVYGDGLHGSKFVGNTDLGRWPANVLLDEDAAAELDEQSGELTSGHWPTDRGEGGYEGGFTGQSGLDGRHASIGGASRFFYVAKPSRAEREQGCDGLTQRQRDDSRKDGNPGGDTPRNRGLQLRGNCHPTVKPVELMRYLVRLVTPKGGTVLDPFTGSGTTGMACAYEGVNFIGIERESEYVEIAERRIASCMPLFSSEVPA